MSVKVHTPSSSCALSSGVYAQNITSWEDARVTPDFWSWNVLSPRTVPACLMCPSLPHIFLNHSRCAPFSFLLFPPRSSLLTKDGWGDAFELQESLLTIVFSWTLLSTLILELFVASLESLGAKHFVKQRFTGAAKPVGTLWCVIGLLLPYWTCFSVCLNRVGHHG